MQERQEQTLVINIYLTRGLMVLLVLALLVALFSAFIFWPQEEAAASNPPAPLRSAHTRPLAGNTGMRQYYLASAVLDATQASNACATDYHMASLWEMLDTSNLKYNVSLGLWQGDSVPGPPSVWTGWVRTGYSSSNINTAGMANCNAWSTTSGYGTTVGLPSNWTAGSQDIHVWAVSTSSCGLPAKVWCVED